MVAETFTKLFAWLCVAFMVLALVFTLGATAHCQTAGTVGVLTGNITVFTNQATSASSGGIWQCGSSTPIQCPVLPDKGFASNTLSFCNSAFVGSIDLEWEPSGASTFVPLQVAVYPTADSLCHSLTVGSYFPNMRSTVTRTAGSVTAYYTASASPISPFAPAIGTNGSTSPISCDMPTSIAAPNSATTWLAISPAFSGDKVILCNWTISFAAAPTTGTVTLNFATDSTCSSLLGTAPWILNTTSSTPQTLMFSAPQNLRNLSIAAYQYPCIVNSSGASIEISFNAASVRGL
jgi:hypothetical protein